MTQAPSLVADKQLEELALHVELEIMNKHLFINMLSI